MYLYIVRHAWAHEHGDPRWPDDSQRPLEAGGAKRFRRVVEALGERGFEPGVIATSPYVRCRQTADLVAKHVAGSPAVVELDALTPGSDFETLLEWTRQSAEAGSVCWVGHAPDVGMLAGALVGDNGASVRFAKGSVAAIRVDGELGYNCGELHWLATAKMLGI
jgi:phosphohistidine phosphatase